MITEERVMTLLARANPEPEESFDLESNAAAYLSTLEQRSSEVTQLDTKRWDRTEKKSALPWLIAAAVVIVTGIGFIFVNQGDEAPFADQPEPTTSEAAASLEVANNYMLALAAHDGAAQRIMFAEGAPIDDNGITADEITAKSEFYGATAWDFLEPKCTRPDTAVPDVVRCTYVMQNDWARTLGVGPFDGSFFRLSIENGEITSLTHRFDISEFGDQVWKPMRLWVGINYPDDLTAMYDEGSVVSRERLDPAAIELWRKHTEEFAALGGANLNE